MIRLPNSLQFRLIAAMIALMGLLAALLLAAVQLQAGIAARELNEAILEARAQDLAQSLKRTMDRGALQRPWVGQRPSTSGEGRVLFAVRDGAGRLLVAQPDWFGTYLQRRGSPWPTGADPRRFRPPAREGGPFYGLERRYQTVSGPVRVAVAHSGLEEGLAHRILGDLARDLFWGIPLLIGGVLAVGVWALRRGLRPVREAAEAAARIGPDSTGQRLPEGEVPTELRPLVGAINRALNRLSHAIEQQRQFTADAAHQLRTPLAVLSAAVEELPEEERGHLRRDIDRMSRLVDQLLQVARLDGALVDTSQGVELTEVAREVVADLAPLALDRGCPLHLEPAPEETRIRGDRQAIARALINLVENALAHSPTDQTVAVTVHTDGRLTVADRGPGLPSTGAQALFRRFHRGPESGSEPGGAGLGLAIAAETMKLHGGSVAAESRPGGGAVFTLAFPRAGGEDPTLPGWASPEPKETTRESGPKPSRE